MVRRVYTAGPVTGVPDYRRRFADAAAALTVAGYEPVSPGGARRRPEGAGGGGVRAAARRLTGAGGVAPRPGGGASGGARMEHDWAAAVGLPVRPRAAWPAGGGGGPVPVRIQRRRTRGWRSHANAIYVGRPSLWASPIRVHRLGSAWAVTPAWGDRLLTKTRTRREAHATAVALYRELLEADERPWWFNARREDVAALAGKDLMCWCPPDLPCHADVLLELANPTDGGPQ